MRWFKESLGSISFVGGLVVIVVAAQKDKSVWWWMVGVGILLAGLDLIIEAKITEAIKKWSGGYDPDED